ncbi:hypothetical protein [Nannocystis punicea]|uniref:Uncharacterized protein n=1 Tax=Nannocystis punicea TaxID=2995304 RepID=A0ABY7GVI0_9BACT|nr:hypothetical protein [Nannocystis poenicansa]WAS90834.1 hypothetical protein O0S08_31990 [Nannocystis poenicansa]
MERGALPGAGGLACLKGHVPSLAALRPIAPKRPFAARAGAVERP